MGRDDDRRTSASDRDAGTTPFLFFTGKGGVGKTTIAAAAAVRLADVGRRVLLVSTDRHPTWPTCWPRPPAGSIRSRSPR